MSTERNSDEGIRSGLMLTVLGWGFAAFVLYVLSVGPVSCIYRSGRAPAFVEALYSPLEALYDEAKPLRNFYDWYLPLWRGE